jgi:membrane-associated protein
MFDLNTLITSGGILIVALIVFTESGLLIGFFLPGDTLLFSAGLLASQGVLPIEWLILAIIAAAIIGDNVGYTIGQKTGKHIFKREDGVFFHKDNIIRAQEFYNKHGGKTITLARFVPVVRTFAPLVAGIGHMDRRKFMAYNVVGAVLWGAGVTLAGYWLGSRLPWLEHYIEAVLIAVIVVSLAASFGHVLKDPKTRKIIIGKIKAKFQKQS